MASEPALWAGGGHSDEDWFDELLDESSPSHALSDADTVDLWRGLASAESSGAVVFRGQAAPGNGRERLQPPSLANNSQVPSFPSYQQNQHQRFHPSHQQSYESDAGFREPFRQARRSQNPTQSYMSESSFNHGTVSNDVPLERTMMANYPHGQSGGEAADQQSVRPFNASQLPHVNNAGGYAPDPFLAAPNQMQQGFQFSQNMASTSRNVAGIAQDRHVQRSGFETISRHPSALGSHQQYDFSHSHSNPQNDGTVRTYAGPAPTRNFHPYHGTSQPSDIQHPPNIFQPYGSPQPYGNPQRLSGLQAFGTLQPLGSSQTYGLPQAHSISQAYALPPAQTAPVQLFNPPPPALGMSPRAINTNTPTKTGAVYGGQTRERLSPRVRMPVNIDIGLVEICTFLPDALQIPKVAMRAVHAGWTALDLANAVVEPVDDLTADNIKTARGRFQKQLAKGASLCHGWTGTFKLESVRAQHGAGFGFDMTSAS
ncbi:uncharacterized protein LTR77_000300 [Saxophila tyrrhenica]|uniref:Uncharacterized protein n=1 Tax=Saxophila tyrrhenica TaxID=1690608 RepID=A0AAV9PS49_9PEZI|nr:hypothetical protein LTR77_000300 [Saxophila tyrrhenica]